MRGRSPRYIESVSSFILFSAFSASTTQHQPLATLVFEATIISRATTPSAPLQAIYRDDDTF